MCVISLHDHLSCLLKFLWEQMKSSCSAHSQAVCYKLHCAVCPQKRCMVVGEAQLATAQIENSTFTLLHGGSIYCQGRDSRPVVPSTLHIPPNFFLSDPWLSNR